MGWEWAESTDRESPGKTTTRERPAVRNRRSLLAAHSVALDCTTDGDGRTGRDKRLGIWGIDRIAWPQAAANVQQAAIDGPGEINRERLGEMPRHAGDSVAWQHAAERDRA